MPLHENLVKKTNISGNLHGLVVYDRNEDDDPNDIRLENITLSWYRQFKAMPRKNLIVLTHEGRMIWYDMETMIPWFNIKCSNLSMFYKKPYDQSHYVMTAKNGKIVMFEKTGNFGIVLDFAQDYGFVIFSGGIKALGNISSMLSSAVPETGRIPDYWADPQNKFATLKPYTEVKGIHLVKNEYGDEHLLIMSNNNESATVQFLGSLSKPSTQISTITTSYSTVAGRNFSAVFAKQNNVLYSFKNDLSVYFKMQLQDGYAFYPHIGVQKVNLASFAQTNLDIGPLDPTLDEIESISFDYPFQTQKMHVAVGLKGRYNPENPDYKYDDGGLYYFIINMTNFTVESGNYARIISNNYTFSSTQPEKIQKMLPGSMKSHRINKVVLKGQKLFIGSSELDYNAQVDEEKVNKGGFVVFEITDADNVWDSETGNITLGIAETYEQTDTDFNGDVWTLNDVWDIKVASNSDFVVYTPVYFWVEGTKEVKPIATFEKIKVGSHDALYSITLENMTDYTKIEIYLKESTETEYHFEKTIYLDSQATVLFVTLDNLDSDKQYNIRAVPYTGGAVSDQPTEDTFTTLVEFEKPILTNTVHDDKILVNIEVTEPRIDDVEYIEVYRMLTGEQTLSRIKKIPIIHGSHGIIPLLSEDPNDVMPDGYSGYINYFKIDIDEHDNMLFNGLGESAEIDIAVEGTNYTFNNVVITSVNYETQVIKIDTQQVEILETEPINLSQNKFKYSVKLYVYEDKGYTADMITSINYYAKLVGEDNESQMSDPLIVATPSRILDPIVTKDDDFWRSVLNFDEYSASLYSNYQNFVFKNYLEQAPTTEILEDAFGFFNTYYNGSLDDFEYQAPITKNNFKLNLNVNQAGDTALVLNTVPSEIFTAGLVQEFFNNGLTANMEVRGPDPQIGTYITTVSPATTASWSNNVLLNDETIKKIGVTVTNDTSSIESYDLFNSGFNKYISKVYKLDMTGIETPVEEIDIPNHPNVVEMTFEEFVENETRLGSNNVRMLQFDGNSVYKFEFERELPLGKIKFGGTHLFLGEHENYADEYQVFEETTTHTDNKYPTFDFPGMTQYFMELGQLYLLSELPAERTFELLFEYSNLVNSTKEILKFNEYRFEEQEFNLPKTRSFILRNKNPEKSLVCNFTSSMFWTDLAPDSYNAYTGNWTRYYRWRATYTFDTTMNANQTAVFSNDIHSIVKYNHNILYLPEGGSELEIESFTDAVSLKRTSETKEINKIYDSLTNAKRLAMQVDVEKVFINSVSGETKITNLIIDSTLSVTDEQKAGIYVKTSGRLVYQANEIVGIKKISIGTSSKSVDGEEIHKMKFIFSADNKNWYYFNTGTKTWELTQYGTKYCHDASNSNLEVADITNAEWREFFSKYEQPKLFVIGAIYLLSDSTGPFPSWESTSVAFEVIPPKKLKDEILSPVIKPPRASKLFDIVIVKDEPKDKYEIKYNTSIQTFIRYSTDNGKNWNPEGWIPIETTADADKLPEIEGLAADNVVYQLKFDFNSSTKLYPTLRKVYLYFLDVYKVTELVYPQLGSPISDEKIDIVWETPENLVGGTVQFAIEVATRDFDDPSYLKTRDRILAYKSFEKNKKPFLSNEFTVAPEKFSYTTYYLPGQNPSMYKWNSIMALDPGVDGLEKINGVVAKNDYYVRFQHSFSTPLTTNNLYFRIYVWDGSMGRDPLQ